MSTLLEIEKAIEKLPPGEVHELHRWVADRDAKQWYNEIAADAESGRFDDLRRRIQADYAAGNCQDL